MEMTRELPRDAEQIEQAFLQNLESEARAWRTARSQRYNGTATGDVDFGDQTR